MSNRKINYNRKVPSSETVNKHQDFKEILANVTIAPTPFFKSIGFWGAVGSSVIALTLLTYQFINSSKKKDAYEAIPTLTVQPTQLPQDTKCLTPVHESTDVEFETFMIDPSKENSFFVEGGAIVTIPANAFDLKEKGSVAIDARVFRTKSEAFLAGVPMDYGNQSAFESAGMIELRGTQNGREIAIDPEKEIRVTLGLHKPSKGFDFYALNESNGEWSEYEATYKDGLVDLDVGVESLKEAVIQTDKEIKEINSELSQLSSPSKAEYHLAENDKQVFELKFNKQEFPELKSFERLQFEAKCNSIRYDEILQKTWSGVELKQAREGQYEAEFFNQRGDKTAVNVVPVVTGDQAEVAFDRYQNAVEQIQAKKQQEIEALEALEQQNDERKARIEELVVEQEQREEQSLERGANVSQEYIEQRAMLTEFYNASATFRTNRWGVFNCDKPVRYPSAPTAPYAFASQDGSVAPSQVYVFDLQKDVRYQFGTSKHSLREVALHNNKTVIVVQDRQGNMSYARVDGKGEILGGQIELTPINTEEADMDFFKTLLDEKERVRA